MFICWPSAVEFKLKKKIQTEPNSVLVYIATTQFGNIAQLVLLPFIFDEKVVLIATDDQCLTRSFRDHISILVSHYYLTHRSLKLKVLGTSEKVAKFLV